MMRMMLYLIMLILCIIYISRRENDNVRFADVLCLSETRNCVTRYLLTLKNNNIKYLIGYDEYNIIVSRQMFYERNPYIDITPQETCFDNFYRKTFTNKPYRYKLDYPIHKLKMNISVDILLIQQREKFGYGKRREKCSSSLRNSRSISKTSIKQTFMRSNSNSIKILNSDSYKNKTSLANKIYPL